jgi:hypothetical protein
MGIKKIITGLTLSLLLGSGVANADWGDVYYCQMTNLNQITLEGEMKSFKLEKFQFKLDQTKNAMVFGNTPVFNGEVFKLTKDKNFPEQEFWYANSSYSITSFREGKFWYTSNMVGVRGIMSISADCNKF